MNVDQFSRLMAATLTIVTIAGSNVSSQIGELQPLWSITVEDHQADGAAARTSRCVRRGLRVGTCFAISTANAVHVVDAASGRERWRWNCHVHNRLIRAGSVAVSPQCDAVAIGGDTNYKYVWIAKRTGRPAYFKNHR
jgi:glucose dehydrogenase